MNKYIINLLLLNSLFLQAFENNITDRMRQDFTLRENLNTEINNYRDEEELLQFIE